MDSVGEVTCLRGDLRGGGAAIPLVRARREPVWAKKQLMIFANVDPLPKVAIYLQYRLAINMPNQRAASSPLTGSNLLLNFFISINTTHVPF